MHGSSSSNNSSSRSYYIAIGILVVLVTWMMSGAFKEISQEKAHPLAELHIPTVQTQQFPLLTIDKTLQLFGRTEPNRNIQVKSEIAGKVVEIRAPEGALVKQGQLLVILDQRDLPERLVQAELRLKQRKVELAAAKELHNKSYTSDVELATANTLIAEANAQVRTLKLAIADTYVKAPFAGFIERHFVELGDYVSVGSSVLQLVDLNPLVVHVDISERHLKNISVNTPANIATLNGDEFVGKIRYVSALSQTGTNTFSAEIAIDNPNMKMAAGVSAEVELILGSENAIKVTPALLAINEDGDIGVKSVDSGEVVFTPANIVKSDKNAFWLNGFSGDVHIITRGQGFVKAGMSVNEVLEGNAQ